MGFGNLRVINEDVVMPGGGFATHGHRDMEIVSYVLSGALAHQDSLGNGSTIHPSEVQRMSAGTGIRHSEHNADPLGSTHFLQIWFLPDAPGGEPDYAQRLVPEGNKRGRLCLIVSPDGQEGSLALRADARLWVGCFEAQESQTLTLPPNRLSYVHLIRGRIEVNGLVLEAGDALMMEQVTRLHLGHGEGAEVLVFDLAPQRPRLPNQ